MTMAVVWYKYTTVYVSTQVKGIAARRSESVVGYFQHQKRHDRDILRVFG